jgi:hypothetical protein
MSEMLDSVKIEIYTTEWIDITADVIDSLNQEQGMADTTYLSRVADPGILELTLENIDGKYSPGTESCLAGWEKGNKIKVTLTYEGTAYPYFYGFIDSIKLNSNPDEDNTVEIRAYDWMKFADEYPSLTSTATNKKLNEMVDLVVTGMPIQPLNKDFTEGNDTFPSVFDISGTRDKAITEFQRGANSELAYIYVTRKNNETLVVESRNTRISKTVDNYNEPKINSFHYKDHDGNLYKDHNNNLYIDHVILPIFFDNTMNDFEAIPWEDVINQVILTVYPRFIDSTVSVLWSLNQGNSSNNTIALEAGQTLTGVDGDYTDPYGGGTKVFGSSMITPVVTTDYKMYANADGTGTDLSANLEVTPDYSVASKVSYILTNTSGTLGYITKLQARGNGVFIYNALKYTYEDATSINKYSYKTLEIEQKYQTNTNTSKDLVQLIVNANKESRTVLKSITLNANTCGMKQFLFLQVGNLIHIKVDSEGIDGYYFVQKIKSTITADGFVDYTITVLESLTFSLTTFTWDVSIWDGPDTWGV